MPEAPPTIDGWRMTQINGKRWSKNGGRAVTLEKGVWSNEKKRWLTPDEIEVAASAA